MANVIAFVRFLPLKMMHVHA